jgi:hypothetical protein
MTNKHTGFGESVKKDIVGTVKGAGDITKATVDTVGSTLSTTLKDAGKVGASTTGAVAHVASGAIHGTKEVVVSGEKAVSATGQGALKAVDKVGSAAVDTASHVATHTIGGVKAVVKEPFKSTEKK